MSNVHSQLANLSSLVFECVGRLGPAETTTTTGMGQLSPDATTIAPPEIESSESDDEQRTDDDDPLEASALMAPMRNLTSRQEAARLRREGLHDERQSRAGHSTEQRSVTKADEMDSFRDPVVLGHCTEAEAHGLFQS